MIYNNTIIPKKKKCVSCGKQEYIFSRGRCRQCATVQDTQKRMERAMEPEERDELQSLIEDLDHFFSRYVRLRECDAEGTLSCYTCDKRLHFTQAHCGHYIHRQDFIVRFDPRNARPQCPWCNLKHNDDPSVYKERLEKENPGITDELLNLSREVMKWTREDLKEMLIDYRQKVKLLEKKLKK